MSDKREDRASVEENGDARKPMSVRESSGYPVPDGANQRPPRPSRQLAADNEEWIVRLAGKGVGGAGAITALRFFLANDPETPVRELLTGSIDLDALHPDELRGLYDRAVPLNPPD